MGAPPEVCITVFSGSYGRINIPQLHHVDYVCFWGTPVVPCLAPRYAQRGGGDIGVCGVDNFLAVFRLF